MKQLLVVLPLAAALVACKPPADSGATGNESSTEVAADADKKPKVAPEDLNFLKDAARGGLAEVQMGQLGVSNGESKPVKDFAQQLIDDHKKINQELEKLAIRKSVILPDSVSEQHKTMLQHMSSLKGREFDSAFEQHAKDEHQKDIEKFKKASASAKDAEVRSFAEKALPVLQRHLDAAQNLSGATTSR